MQFIRLSKGFTYKFISFLSRFFYFVYTYKLLIYIGIQIHRKSVKVKTLLSTSQNSISGQFGIHRLTHVCRQKKKTTTLLYLMFIVAELYAYIKIKNFILCRYTHAIPNVFTSNAQWSVSDTRALLNSKTKKP